ncbi:extracellular solute-binding protein [Paenibacillus azoreducens]|uniref:Iron ABC transporter substrate-binding protein n=1 Tax=Paenibacillus azoreducens TaxID=116718 RepID=A0A919YCV9_9BACL|nr:extracellular solute-binding protein [Paenibacillus azoreducens]GIO46878.1 iron ABC transporter substrate-binding protein [Paenibacillus azoreducens]
MKKKWLKLGMFGVALAMTVGLTACGGGEKEQQPAASGGDGGKKGSQKLVIYTARDKNVVEQILPKFKELNPDIDVEVMTMGAQQIMERVRGEKANPQADFWWGGTQSSFITAANEGLLESYKPSYADSVPAEYKDAQDRWYGEMLLPEVIMYNSEAIKEADAPKDWDDLLDPKWKDKILIRGVMASGTMRTIYDAMIYRQDPANPEKGYEWLKKLDANTKEYTQDPTQLYLKLARQEGILSLWNLQDILLQKELQKQPFDYIYPASGAPILVDGVGIVKGAKNMDAAKKFFDFIFDKDQLKEKADKLFQIPTRTDIDKNEFPDWYKKLDTKQLDLDWMVLADKEKEWMQYWDENIKGKGGK